MHLIGANLHFEAVAKGPNHRRVQRLIHVGLRYGDVVFKATWQRLPERVDKPQRLVTGGHRLHDQSEGDDIVDLIELDAPGPHLLIDAVEVLEAPLDLETREVVLGQLGAQDRLDFLDVFFAGLFLLLHALM